MSATRATAGGYRHRLLLQLAVALSLLWAGWELYAARSNWTTPVNSDLSAAHRALQDGRFDRALALYRQVLQQQPGTTSALRGTAQAQLQIGVGHARTADRLRRSGSVQQAAAATQRMRFAYRRSLAVYDQLIEQQPATADDPAARLIQGVNYANRGILRDRMADHTGALADYRQAIRLNPEVQQRPGWLHRLLYNQSEPPPSVADRADYLQQQLALPAARRLLTRLGEDAQQRTLVIN